MFAYLWIALMSPKSLRNTAFLCLILYSDRPDKQYTRTFHYRETIGIFLNLSQSGQENQRKLFIEAPTKKIYKQLLTLHSSLRQWVTPLQKYSQKLNSDWLLKWHKLRIYRHWSKQTNKHIALLCAYLSHPLTKEKQNAPALKTQPSSKFGAVVYIKCCGSLDVHSSRIKPLPTFFADREEFYNTRAPQTLDACPRARA